MEITKALPLLKEVVKNNKTLSILQTIKLEGNMLSATDLETTVTIKVDGLNIDQPAIVNAKLFDGVVNSIKSKDIKITTDSELKNIIRVNEFKLPTQKIEEYPQKPPTDNQMQILTGSQDLVNDLVTASKFASHEVGREVLSTILFDLVHQTITATDSYKLFQKKVNFKNLITEDYNDNLKQRIGGIYETGEKKFATGFLLPVNAITLLSKIKQTINEISIATTKDNLIINIDNTIEIIQRRFSDGTVYPGVQDIIDNARPQNANYQFNVFDSLIRVLEPAKIYTGNSKDPVPIQIDYSIPGQFKLIADNKELGKSEQIITIKAIKYEPQRIIEGKEPEKQSIAFNYDFLITSLKAILQNSNETREAILSIQEPLKPMTLTNDNESTTILLMPYRVR
jgi:hypothetical protein